MDSYRFAFPDVASPVCGLARRVRLSARTENRAVSRVSECLADRQTADSQSVRYAAHHGPNTAVCGGIEQEVAEGLARPSAATKTHAACLGSVSLSQFAVLRGVRPALPKKGDATPTECGPRFRTYNLKRRVLFLWAKPDKPHGGRQICLVTLLRA